MDSAQVGVFEQPHEICFGSLLKSQDCRGLESEVLLVLKSDLLHESLEREFPNEEIC